MFVGMRKTESHRDGCFDRWIRIIRFPDEVLETIVEEAIWLANSVDDFPRIAAGSNLDTYRHITLRTADNILSKV
jgi:hypothetical protein